VAVADSPVKTRHVNPWIIAFSVMLCTFMEVLDTTVVNVSLPHIAGDLSATIEEATWVLTSYLVANAIVLPITGWLANHFGRKRHAVGYDDLMGILKADNVKIESGDMVCIYTGFADVLLEMKKKPDPKLVNETCTGLNGRDEKLLQWITDSGLSVLLADNYAVELIRTALTDPLPRKQPWLPLHEHCLFKNGIHLGEMFYFSELARWLREHQRNRFLFTAPPLRLPGAVGSPSTPIATV